MDQLISSDKINILTPALIIITFLSSFKGGKPTCDRYIINYFLYLLTSISLYIFILDKVENGSRDMVMSLIYFISIIGLFLLFSKTQNIWVKHIIWISILFLLAKATKGYYEHYGKKDLNSVLSKIIIIIGICIVISILFPQYLTPKLEVGLLFGLIFVILFRIIDGLILKNNYNNIISIVSVFLFSLFIVYDSGRVINISKECAKNNLKPEYLDRVIDMFLNIMNLFMNLVSME